MKSAVVHGALLVGAAALLLVLAPGDLGGAAASSSSPVPAGAAAVILAPAGKPAASQAPAPAGPALANEHLSVVVNQTTGRVWIVAKDGASTASVVGTTADVQGPMPSPGSKYQAQYDSARQAVSVVDPNTKKVVATVPVGSTTTVQGFTPPAASPPGPASAGFIGGVHQQGVSTVNQAPAGWPH